MKRVLLLFGVLLCMLLAGCAQELPGKSPASPSASPVDRITNREGREVVAPDGKVGVEGPIEQIGEETISVKVKDKVWTFTMSDAVKDYVALRREKNKPTDAGTIVTVYYSGEEGAYIADSIEYVLVN